MPLFVSSKSQTTPAKFHSLNPMKRVAHSSVPISLELNVWFCFRIYLAIAFLNTSPKMLNDKIVSKINSPGKIAR